MTPREKAIEAMVEASHEAFRQMCAEWEAPLKWSDVEEEVREETRQNSAAQLDALLAELPGLGLQVVPVVATDEMINAWNDAELPSCVGLSDEECNTAVGRADYAAMCAAAPNVLEGEKT